jgi:hypothetical protein
MKYATLCCLLALTAVAFAQDDAAKPKVATFPLGGDSPASLRDWVGFSIRTKLDRDGAYDPIDGPTMLDMAAGAKAPISFDTDADAIKDLARDSGAVVLIWGDASPSGQGNRVRLKTLDLRNKDAAVATFQDAIADNTQVRFVVERFLATLPGVAPFQHPNDEPVHHDKASDALFATNPNMVVNGDFSQAGHWDAIYQSEKYAVPLSDEPPVEDKVVINRVETRKNALAMDLSYDCATNNGMAALSDAIEIQPGVRYRISFRYRSDGPDLHVFVKGYTLAKDVAGALADVEIYRLQVPPSGATGNRWQTVEADIHPYNPNFPVQRLRVDLYAYLHPGHVWFTDVKIAAVGRMPATQP